jgi:hypothetical protein
LLLAGGAACAQDAERATALQPVQEYFLPWTAPEGQPASPFLRVTHLGTEYGPTGAPGALRWEPGRVVAEPRDGQRAGAWHSLGREGLDFAACYGHIIPGAASKREAVRVSGIFVRAAGDGTLRLELTAPDGTLLWQRVQAVQTAGDPKQYVLACEPGKLRRLKSLTWEAEPGSRIEVDAVGLVVQFPPMSFGKRVFLMSYAKLARGYEPSEGVAADKAHVPAARFAAVPATGMFALATAAAATEGIVSREGAEAVLRTVHRTVSSVPTARGLLPHFLRKQEGRWRACPGTEFSTVDTALYYHAMLIAAQVLGQEKVLAELTAAIKRIEFDQLRDAEGYVLHGLREDGRTPLRSAWRGWGGESALVVLLEHVARGDRARMRMGRSGRVFRGVGFIAEVQSLFYPRFDLDRPDAVTGVNWRAARRRLLEEQTRYFPRHHPQSAAARLGLYGLSAGAGYRAMGYVANGTRRADAAVIHPHYILMSACLREPGEVYSLLRAMEERGLFPPWGLVENVTPDLDEYLPMNVSLNASFEALSAYHLWCKAAGRPDCIHGAARTCPPLAAAIRAFYPATDSERASRGN